MSKKSEARHLDTATRRTLRLEREAFARGVESLAAWKPLPPGRGRHRKTTVEDVAAEVRAVYRDAVAS